jgi:hypothetical protein
MAKACQARHKLALMGERDKSSQSAVLHGKIHAVHHHHAAHFAADAVCGDFRPFRQVKDMYQFALYGFQNTALRRGDHIIQASGEARE